MVLASLSGRQTHDCGCGAAKSEGLAGDPVGAFVFLTSVEKC
jgi:hypothetical protein